MTEDRCFELKDKNILDRASNKNRSWKRCKSAPDPDWGKSEQTIQGPYPCLETVVDAAHGKNVRNMGSVRVSYVLIHF